MRNFILQRATTKSYLKRMNRKLEFLFRDAELVSVCRFLQGGDYPAEKLRELYKLFLVNQFHDILPGSHITPVWRDAVADLEKIHRELNEILSGGDKLVNTLNFPRTLPVFVPGEGDFCRRGQNGRFMLCTGEALGNMQVYSCGRDDWYHWESGTVKTDFYTAKINPDGSFSSLCDAGTGREWAAGDFNTLRVYRDCPGNYDAWDILPDYEDVQYPVSVETPLALVRADNTAVEFSCVLTVGESRWQRILRFFRFSPGVEVENVVDWQEKHKLAKAVFDVNVLSRELVCDTSAGFIRRETHRNTTWQQARFEVCHHKWCDMAETDGGVALINEGKYGVGAKNNTVSLSLLRATVRPDPSSDMGRHDFCYLIYPHAGSFADAEINRRAFEYNVPPVRCDGISLPFAVPEELFLSCVKLSEDGERIVVRLIEQDGKRGVFLPGRTVELCDLTEQETEKTDRIAYHPFEIITFAVPVKEVLS